MSASPPTMLSAQVDAMAAGLSADRLDRVASYLDDLVEKKIIPCWQVVVARHGKVGYVGMGGSQNQGGEASLSDSPKPIAEDTLFRIYSMTKPITSVALMQLYEQGKFMLNHPVHLYLGQKWKKSNMRVFKSGHPRTNNVQTVPLQKNITILQVLTHTSGLSYGFDPNGVINPVDAILTQKMKAANAEVGSGNLTLEGMCDALPEVPLCFQPGSSWLYGYNTDVCSRLVEVISGMRFSDYCEKFILGPLKMHDTKFYAAPQDQHRLADCFAELPKKALGEALRNVSKQPTQIRYLSDTSPAMESGGGGLVSSAHDYYRFCQMILGGGTLDGEMILSKSTVSWMGTNHLPGGKDLSEMPAPFDGYSEMGGPGVGFGLGFSVHLDPAATSQISSVGDLAWGGAANTAFWIDRAEDMCVIFMTQVLQQDRQKTPIRETLGAIVHGAIMADPKQSKSRL